MGYSFTYFAVSMALAIASRLTDEIQWTGKNEDVWLVISRVVLLIALVMTIMALVELIKYIQLC